MQLLNRQNLLFELKGETLEDLWILSQFITQGDKIFSKTERKVKIGSGEKQKQVKKIIYVELVVSKTSFENNVLRVSGEIQNETEFTKVGASHSLTFEINDVIKVQKFSLLKFEEKLLQNALKLRKSLNLLILLDKDELIACEFGEFTYKTFIEKKRLGSKKYTGEEIDEDEQKFKLIENLLTRDYSNIILAGPGIYKEKLKKYIKEITGRNLTTFSYPEVSTNAIQKAIKKISEKKIMQTNQLAIENEMISKLLENINKGEKYVYGSKNTNEAINDGRVEILLISSKLINKAKEKGTYQELNELLRLVEQLNGNLVIISSENEPGRILDGLGGIAGILRY